MWFSRCALYGLAGARADPGGSEQEAGQEEGHPASAVVSNDPVREAVIEEDLKHQQYMKRIVWLEQILKQQQHQTVVYIIASSTSVQSL